jgi:iron complex outermembrane receptor protein
MLRGQIENPTDRDYWASAGGYPGLGYLVPRAPRSLTVLATIDF